MSDDRLHQIRRGFTDGASQSDEPPDLGPFRALAEPEELTDAAVRAWQFACACRVPADNVWLAQRRAEHGALTRLLVACKPLTAGRRESAALYDAMLRIVADDGRRAALAATTASAHSPSCSPTTSSTPRPDCPSTPGQPPVNADFEVTLASVCAGPAKAGRHARLIAATRSMSREAALHRHARECPIWPHRRSASPRTRWPPRRTPAPPVGGPESMVSSGSRWRVLRRPAAATAYPRTHAGPAGRR